MSDGHVLETIVELESGGDAGAMGAAITVALCGDWRHDGPCRWPHHSAVVERYYARVVTRTVFVAEPGDLLEVRRRVAGAVSAGVLITTERTTRWRVLRHGEGTLMPTEAQAARKLAGDVAGSADARSTQVLSHEAPTLEDAIAWYRDLIARGHKPTFTAEYAYVDGAFDVDILELPGVGTGAESPEAVELRSRERIGGWLEVEDAAFDVRVVHGEDIPD